MDGDEREEGRGWDQACEEDRMREEVGRGHGRKMEMAGQISVFLGSF